jgi:hypothetical protein
MTLDLFERDVRFQAAVTAADRWFRRQTKESLRASDALPFLQRNYPDVDHAAVIRELGERLRRRYGG